MAYKTDKSSKSTAPVVPPGGLSLSRVVYFALVLSFFFVTVILLGPSKGWIGILEVALYELPAAVLIFISAGGWGWILLHKWMPQKAVKGLKAGTYVGTGLWILGTSVLVAGRFIDGAFNAALWWPVIGGGMGLALWGGKPYLRNKPLSQRIGLPMIILTLLFSLIAALWLAGASLPAGLIGRANGDYYDVVSYHLQVPREFYESGQIQFLPHNTYSNYPLGLHMLYLLGMTLRGGAFQGVYTAKLIHGLFGVMACLSLFYGFPKKNKKAPYTSVIFLASMPGIVYVSWLAFAELSQVAYMVTGLLWLLYWIEADGKDEKKAAAFIGMAAGAACATKYLSVGLVAGPLLLIMFVFALFKRKKYVSVLTAVTASVVMFFPWLLRNFMNTGNPVFPLATSIFGLGHWTEEMGARWDAGHAPRPVIDKFPQILETLTGITLFGPIVVFLAFAAVILVLKSSDKKWRLVVLVTFFVFLLQLKIWALATHMPGRFLLPAAAPIAILGGMGVESILEQLNKFSTKASFPLVMGIIIAALTVNLAAIRYLYFREPAVETAIHGLNQNDLSQIPGWSWLRREVGPDGKMLSVGDAQAFVLPERTVYTSAWEKDLLVKSVRRGRKPAEILYYLRHEHGITHIWFNWSEIERLRNSYGWWDEVSPDIVEGLIIAGAVEITPPEELHFYHSPSYPPPVQLLKLPPLIRARRSNFSRNYRPTPGL